jgi:hypothetical protein
VSKGYGKTGHGPKMSPAVVAALAIAASSTEGRAGRNYEVQATKVATYFKERPEALKRVKDYTGSGSRAMNLMAIEGYDATVKERGKEEAQRLLKKARALQLALHGAPKLEATVYRGMTLPRKTIDELVARGEFSAKNFFSTSISKGRAFSGKVKLTIRQHSGVPVEKVSSVAHEREVLLPAGTRYKVTSVRKVRSTYHIHMTEVRR